MSESILELDRVTRRFGATTALDAVSLACAPGSVLGIIGRNAAGKTTALRLAHGLLHPDAGRVRTLGLDPAAQGLEVRTRVSLLSEESALYPWMRVSEILRFAAGIHPRWDTALAETFRKRLDLDPAAKIASLSRGTRAKVALVLAVACRPELLLLDDPTAGLDPLVRREVLEAILDAVSGEGGAVVYASHLIHDVERVADRVAVLDGGTLRLEGGVDELKSRIKRARAVFEGEAPAPGIAAIHGAIDAQSSGRVLTVVADRPNGEMTAALRALGAREVAIETLPLEEILVALLRGGAASEVERA